MRYPSVDRTTESSPNNLKLGLVSTGCGKCVGILWFLVSGRNEGRQGQVEMAWELWRLLETDAKASDVWEQIKASLAAKITPQAYQNWLMRTELESQDNGSLRVLVPDQVTKDFLEQEYGKEVREAIRELNLQVRDVVYVAGSPGAASGGNTSAEVVPVNRSSLQPPGS